ncbi:MAG TPA: class I SAM-dependent methyltransferase [Kiritimatiellia bacterium]|nr:class I SAM-dependent methyltransferase [Kiritimatiellia bacterium]
MKTAAESTHLERIAADSWYSRGANSLMIDYSFRVFRRYIGEGSILEMGPAEGVMTEHLAVLAQPLTLLEGAALFCERLRSRFPHCTVVHSLFEEYRPEQAFDCIILGHVLEHVEDPAGIVRRAKSWLAPGGRILAAVPNARSLHRQAAVLMGLLPFEESLNEADLHHGHRRVFNPETFRQVFLAAGLRIEVFGGYWLKPLSNRQLEDTWTPEMMDAFMALGERYPDIAAEIYVVAGLPEGPGGKGGAGA